MIKSELILSGASALRRTMLLTVSRVIDREMVFSLAKSERDLAASLAKDLAEMGERNSIPVRIFSGAIGILVSAWLEHSGRLENKKEKVKPKPKQKVSKRKRRGIK